MRHATTTMHPNHAPRAHIARWKAPTELRLIMEQLRALGAYKTMYEHPDAHVCYVRCRTGHVRCYAVPHGLLTALHGAERATSGSLRSRIRTSVRSSYDACTEFKLYATYGAPPSEVLTKS